MSDNAYTPPSAAVADRFASGNNAISPGMMEHLRRTRIWVLIVAIVFLVAALFTILVGVGMISGSSFMAASSELQSIGGTAMLQGMGAFYLLMSVLFYLIPSILLFRYSGAISRAVNSNDTLDVETAISRQAGFWKYVGIFMLIMVILVIVGIVLAIAIPAMMMGGIPTAP